MTLPNARRPSRMPACRTSRPRLEQDDVGGVLARRRRRRRPRCRRRRACSEGASLMPSPRKPTTWPRRLSAQDDPVLLRGRDAREHASPARRRARARRRSCARARRRARSAPPSSPTWPQTCRATSSLSPVRILTAHAVARERARSPRRRPSQRRIGEGRRSRRASARARRRAVKPSLRATRRGRRPRARGTLARSASRNVASQRARVAGVERRACAVDLVRACSTARTLSGAPFVMSRRSPSRLDDDRQPAALEVERDLVDLAVARRRRRRRARGSPRRAGS